MKGVGYFKTQIPDKIHLNKIRDIKLSVKLENFIIQPLNQVRGYILKDPKPIRIYAIFVQEHPDAMGSEEEPIEKQRMFEI